MRKFLLASAAALPVFSGTAMAQADFPGSKPVSGPVMIEKIHVGTGCTWFQVNGTGFAVDHGPTLIANTTQLSPGGRSVQATYVQMHFLLRVPLGSFIYDPGNAGHPVLRCEEGDGYQAFDFDN
jgi:hypothetical protein